MKETETNSFSGQLLTWYKLNKRRLPWRQSNNPYRIWLSEIILQQTRVAQGLPYYAQFVKQYPQIEQLAAAKEDDVLRLWQGLGYYSRARNLHKCAKIIVENHHGKFPETMKELLLLPGIGKYTAAAIASLAYDEPVPVVDGNVYRVLSRYFGVKQDIASSKAYNHFYQLSTTLINHQNPGDYNQAVMEFGALHCTPKKPLCDNCVLRTGCFAFEYGKQDTLPVKRRKLKSKARFFYYLLIRNGDKYLMRQRTASDIWHGLYEFVLIETPKQGKIETLEHAALQILNDMEAEFVIDDKIFRHILSHQVLNVNFAVVNIKANSDIIHRLATDRYNWYSLSEVEALPKPILISNYLDTYLNSINLQ